MINCILSIYPCRIWYILVTFHDSRYKDTSIFIRPRAQPLHCHVFFPPVTHNYSQRSLWHSSYVSPSFVHIRICRADTDQWRWQCGRWREQQRYWQQEMDFTGSQSVQLHSDWLWWGLVKANDLLHPFLIFPCPPLFFSPWWTVMCLNWVPCLIVVNWGNHYNPPTIHL